MYYYHLKENMNLKPIKPKRISDQVFEQIRELIFKGDFKAGQQILPERDLALVDGCQSNFGEKRHQ